MIERTRPADGDEHLRAVFGIRHTLFILNLSVQLLQGFHIALSVGFHIQDALGGGPGRGHIEGGDGEHRLLFRAPHR